MTLIFFLLLIFFPSFFLLQQDDSVADFATRKTQVKSEGDIAAVQSLLAMSQWSPPSPEHSVSPTSDQLQSVSLDLNNHVTLEKVTYMVNCLIYTRVWCNFYDN